MISAEQELRQSLVSRPVKTELRHHVLPSSILKCERKLVLSLPAAYAENPDCRYPVLYLQDGQNIFQSETSFTGVAWCADETAHQLALDGDIEPLIIVGIYNAGDKRIAEYTPTRDRKQGGGKADRYGRMLVEEVMPFVEAEYRTLSGPTHTAIGGSSLGGLVSLYLALQNPERFGRAAVMSPSVWWNRRSILRLVGAISPKPRVSIWLDIGTAEGEGTLADVRALRDLLVGKGWIEGQDLRYTEVAGGTHGEASWGERIAPMLKFLFPSRSL